MAGSDPRDGDERDALGRRIGARRGTPNGRIDARQTATARAMLGRVGVLGEGRLAVGYRYADRCEEYHVQPVRAYDRSRDRMDYGGHGHRIDWPMRPYDAEGTGAVRASSLVDLNRDALSPALRASLGRERYVGSAAWFLRPASARYGASAS